MAVTALDSMHRPALRHFCAAFRAEIRLRATLFPALPHKRLGFELIQA
jgi:hypothetical protein